MDFFHKFCKIIKRIYEYFIMSVKKTVTIWMMLGVCFVSLAQSHLDPLSQKLRNFLSWVYKKQPELYASLQQQSDEALEICSAKLANHIIYVQSVKNSSDMYSANRKAVYQRILFQLMKNDQEEQKKISPPSVSSKNESKDQEDIQEAPELASSFDVSEAPQEIGSFVLRQELRDREIDRERRSERILQRPQENSHNKKTLHLLIEAIYDEIFHRVYLFTRYAQALCFQDLCVEKIQTILSSSMEDFMKIKHLMPLLHTLEKENTSYAHKIISAQEPKESLEMLPFALPGVCASNWIKDSKHAALLENVLKLYPDSLEKKRIYHALCIAFLAHMMGEMAIRSDPPLSILALMLDASEELHHNWDTERFRNVLLNWPENDITSPILIKHLKKLAHIIPIALTEKKQWEIIAKSCEEEYKKITTIVQKVIKNF
ncbi:hypothetical protein HE1_00299 [Holospora elegans E1]|uniref:Uncharacterized protein n=2 Tax=Holospora TaxID=44747 RepID=A0A023DYF2_9PROT|nr:hypothetical protein HE1_00299 [Holospora elegans E1]